MVGRFYFFVNRTCGPVSTFLQSSLSLEIGVMVRVIDVAGGELELATGENIAVEMTEMGSAGYLWNLAGADQAIVEVVQIFRSIPERQPSASIGDWNTITVWLNALKPGETKLFHERPFDRSQVVGCLRISVEERRR
jgi:hypothetical protein